MHQPRNHKNKSDHKAFPLKIVNLVIIKNRNPKNIDLKQHKLMKMVPYQPNISINQPLPIALILGNLQLLLTLFHKKYQQRNQNHVPDERNARETRSSECHEDSLFELDLDVVGEQPGAHVKPGEND